MTAVHTESDIAIVGMAGRFPGARDIDEFWRNLTAGIESIARLSDQDLLIGKPSNRLDACGQVTPELVDVARAWEATGHPDDGDIGLGMHGSHQRPTRMSGSGKALRSAFPLGVTGIASILSNRLGII